MLDNIHSVPIRDIIPKNNLNTGAEATTDSVRTLKPHTHLDNAKAIYTKEKIFLPLIDPVTFDDGLIKG